MLGFRPDPRWDRDQADGRKGRFETAPYLNNPLCRSSCSHLRIICVHLRPSASICGSSYPSSRVTFPLTTHSASAGHKT